MPLVYFDNAATTQRPRQVIQAIVDAYEEHYANVHRGIHTLSEEIDELYEGRGRRCGPSSTPPASRPRATAPPRPSRSSSPPARRIRSTWWRGAGATPTCARATKSSLTEMEHHSNLVPWYQLAERTGAVVRHIPLTDDGRLQLDALDRLLTRRTKLVAVAAVSNVLGTINPVAEIIRRAHDVGAVVLVDGAQSVPHQKTDVQALDCDFLAFSGHKMLGPLGRRRALRQAGTAGGDAAVPGRRRDDQGGDAGRVSARCSCPAKFEAGTPPIVPAVALGAAIDYLNAVGPGGHRRSTSGG